METTSYTRRPDTVEAVQVLNDNIIYEEVEGYTFTRKTNTGLPDHLGMLVDDATNTRWPVFLTDWILKDAAGRFSVIDDQTFKAYYTLSISWLT